MILKIRENKERGGKKLIAAASFTVVGKQLKG